MDPQLAPHLPPPQPYQGPVETKLRLDMGKGVRPLELPFLPHATEVAPASKPHFRIIPKQIQAHPERAGSPAGYQGSSAHPGVVQGQSRREPPHTFHSCP